MSRLSVALRICAGIRSSSAARAVHRKQQTILCKWSQCPPVADYWYDYVNWLQTLYFDISKCNAIVTLASHCRGHHSFSDHTAPLPVNRACISVLERLLAQLSKFSSKYLPRLSFINLDGNSISKLSEVAFLAVSMPWLSYRYSYHAIPGTIVQVVPSGSVVAWQSVFCQGSAWFRID